MGCVLISERHKQYGVLQGVWVTQSDGRQFYCCDRSMRKINRKLRSWVMDLGTLNEAKRRQVETIIIRSKRKGKKPRIWAAPLEMFFDKTKSTFVNGTVSGRALPIDQFPIRPDILGEEIEALMKVR